MRGPKRVVLKLTGDQSSSVRSQADLDVVDFGHNLVNIEGWFVTEANILCDAVETGQRVDASNDIAVHMFDARNG